MKQLSQIHLEGFRSIKSADIELRSFKLIAVNLFS